MQIRPALFVNRISDCNVGDKISSPLRYFSHLFPNALKKEVHLSRNRALRAWPALLRNVSRVTVVGGGGLIGQPFFKGDIEFWARGPSPAVLWGAGHNSHNVGAVDHTRPFYEEYGDLRYFSLIGVRDYGLGFNWVPCASCMEPSLLVQSTRRIGTVIALHWDLRRDPASVRAIVDQADEYTILYNDCSPTVFFETLKAASRIVTNSYHAAYLGTLLQKPVVAIGGGSKIRTLRHAVPVADAKSWRSGFDDAVIYKDALDECRQANVDFSKRVQELARLGETRSFKRDPLAERAADAEVSPVPFPKIHRAEVPKIVHFIFGLSPDFGGKPFNIMHRIAVQSAIRKINPEEVRFHYHYKPATPAFKDIEGDILLRKVDVPTEFRGKRLRHFAHKADILRMNILREDGGIYMDLDTITVGSFDRFLDQSFTIGLQRSRQYDGLCNAVMLAAPGDQFLTDWLTSYERFSDDEWDRFSVRLPYLMWRSGRWSINVEPYDRFHWPSFSPDGLRAMFEMDNSFDNAACHHLWESFSYRRYFGELTDTEAAEMLRTSKSTYGRLAREYL